MSESALESPFASGNGLLGMLAARAASRDPTWVGLAGIYQMGGVAALLRGWPVRRAQDRTARARAGAGCRLVPHQRRCRLCGLARASGDDDFFLRAAEILLETVRFWASRAVAEADGRRHIRHVIGPDEYHEDVDDNAFTNLMARRNIARALEAVERAL